MVGGSADPAFDVKFREFLMEPGTQEVIASDQAKARSSCADTYAPGPPYFPSGVPAFCVVYAPEAQGSWCATVRAPYANEPRACRTYRLPCGAPQELGIMRKLTLTLILTLTLTLTTVAPQELGIMRKIDEMEKLEELQGQREQLAVAMQELQPNPNSEAV